MTQPTGLTVWTIGHSTRTTEEFVELLKINQIDTIVDVRRWTLSKKHPHFSGTELPPALLAEGINYHWIEALGGRRDTTPDSPHVVWRNASFRGYADHMQTDTFAEGFDELVNMTASRKVAIMCSEAVWWRCHRSMISDDLRAHGIEVRHILSKTQTMSHPMTAPARIVDGKLTYLEG